MTRILETYERESYWDSINDGNIDNLDRINMLDNEWLKLYAVGDKYCNGEIVDIYYHNTSDCAWIIIRTEDGGYFEVDINGVRQYCDEESYTVFN